MNSSVTLSRDVFLFLMELAGMEADNMDMDEDQRELWEEAVQEIE